MGLGVDVFLRHLDVRDLLRRHHQVEIHTLEQEDGGVLQAAGDGGLADQCPLAGQPVVAAVLQRGSRLQVALQEGLDRRSQLITLGGRASQASRSRGHACTDLGGHAVGDAEGQVLLDALHAVAVLLLGGPQVLLQSPGHGREDGLGCLPGVHHVPRSLLLLLLLHSLDVREGLLYRHHQPGRRHSISDGNRGNGTGF